MSTNYSVYVGMWINWSRGAVYGATLSLPGRNAAIPIAALALFVGFTGTKSWSVICFVVHQLGTTRSPRDGMYHQIQATLRNNGSGTSAIWQLLKVSWAWSSCRSRSFRSSLGIMVMGTVHITLFTAAGLLSFRLTTLGNEVLVRSPKDEGKGT